MPRILSIDGGGIRGIIPAIVLADLEQRTGRPTADMFDMLAGTSTGGIIALALVRPDGDGRPAHSADDLVRFYSELGPDIFRRSLGRQVRTVASLAGPKYDQRPLERALDRHFGDTLLSAALRDVLVTAYDIERREPYFFKSHYARVMPERDFPMKDAARATSAGPTYFAPHQLPTMDHIGYRALIDGGVFANNPGMCAYVEALNLFGVVDQERPGRAPASDTAGPVEHEAGVAPGAGRSARYQPRVESWEADWLVLSLGTGQNEREIPYAQARGWGLASWARPVLDVVFDGVSDTVDYQLRHVLPDRSGQPPRYYRLQTRLVEASVGLGDANPDNMRRLKQSAYELVRDAGRALGELAARLR